MADLKIPVIGQSTKAGRPAIGIDRRIGPREYASDMAVTLIAAGVGLLLGLAAGGRARHAFEHRWSLWPLLLLGLALQMIPEIANLSESQALLPVLGSYAALIVFGFANLSVMGIVVVIVGLGLNMTATAVNTGMPVDGPALVTAGLAQPDELDRLDLGSRRHVSVSTDRLSFLGDIIPVEPLHAVLSFGDLIMAFGVGDLLFRLLRPVGPRERRASTSMSEALAVLDLSIVDLTSQRSPDALVDVIDVIDLTGETAAPTKRRGSQPSIEAAR